MKPNKPFFTILGVLFILPLLVYYTSKFIRFIISNIKKYQFLPESHTDFVWSINGFDFSNETILLILILLCFIIGIIFLIYSFMKIPSKS